MTPEQEIKKWRELAGELLINSTITTDKVTRVEVIDDRGRSYTNNDWRNKVEVSFQDEGRTLKIFISKRDYDEYI